MNNGVAIVGIACEYPDAHSPMALWENVLARNRAFRRIPAARLNPAYYSSDPNTPDKTYARQAAVIEGYAFDRVAFRIPAPTFEATDMVHWLALDVAARALADAGYLDGARPAAYPLPRETTGVLIGNSLTGEFTRSGLMRLRWPYVQAVLDEQLRDENWPVGDRRIFLDRLERSYKKPFPEIGEESLAGGLANTIAGRICNYLDLKGGGYTLDGACASSLLAAAQACSALIARDIDLAIVGGVDLSLDPFELVGFAKTKALTPDEMRVFDRDSQGFIPGEGCGVLILRRAEEAIEAGQKIYAFIRGWGLSSDGKGGMTRPEQAGQALALQRAYRRAGLAPGAAGLFEGHGTGTRVGDETELSALAEVRASDMTLAALGSIKANIGHTKAAAGAAGLIKAAMALHTRIIPPATGFLNPHPLVAKANLFLPEQAQIWPETIARTVGVSAMGFGGINAHLVLAGREQSPRTALNPRERRLIHSRQDAELFVLSDDQPDGLARKVKQAIETARDLAYSELAGFARFLVESSSHGPYRAAVIAASPRELRDGLGRLLEDSESFRRPVFPPGKGRFFFRFERTPRIGFLFPGHSGPLNRPNAAFSHRFPDLQDQNEALVAKNGLGVQARIVNDSILGLSLCRRFAVEASVAVGHSLGELTALHWAGALSDVGLLTLAQSREAALSEGAETGGAMLAVSSEAARLEPFLRQIAVRVAVDNSPNQTVVAGPSSEITALADALRANGVASTILDVPFTFHSSFVSGAASLLKEKLAGFSFHAPERRIFSTVTGQELQAETDLRDHLRRHVTAPVLFRQALERADPEVDLWVEVGAGSVLADLAQSNKRRRAVFIHIGGSSLAPFLSVLAANYCLGGRPRLDRLFDDRLFKPFDPKRQNVFFVNPCEKGPALTEEHAPADAPSIAVVEAPDAIRSDPRAAEAPVVLVKRLIAARAELPIADLNDDIRVLDGLHLNSIAIASIIADAASRLGIAAPLTSAGFANATIAEIGDLLEARLQSEAFPVIDEAFPAGVEPWLRFFETVWRPLPRASFSNKIGQAAWTIIAPPDHAIKKYLARFSSTEARTAAVIVCLPEKSESLAPDLLIEGVQTVLSRKEPCVFAVIQETPLASSFCRSFFLEHPAVPTLVFNALFEEKTAPARIAAELAGVEGFLEIAYDDEGRRTTPGFRILELFQSEQRPMLGPDDRVLVTGGGKGVTAECALALGRATGAELVLWGRSDPRDDEDLARGLARFADAGIRSRYMMIDVCDSDQVRCGLNEIGAIHGLIHGAGANHPRGIVGLDRRALDQTAAAKVTGLRNILAAIDSGSCKLLLGFGSIIGRIGLWGEADYAYANNLMALAIQGYSHKHPACRCLTLDWSLWSGAGMGERLANHAFLEEKGVAPLSIAQGVDAFLNILARPDLTGRITISGRFGDSSLLNGSLAELPFQRFLERVKVHYHRTELVAEACLSHETDPYLRQHVIEDAPVFPAVLGLEAMVQAATALVGVDAASVRLEELVLDQPIIVRPDARVVLRIAALVRDAGTVEVVIRTDATGFKTDHFRVLVRFGRAWSDKRTDERNPAPEFGAVSQNEFIAADLYGSVLFHKGPFRRIRGYRLLTAFQCQAELSATSDYRWFGPYLPQTLSLGDPGKRDAALHAVMPCLPQKTLLPLGFRAFDVFHQSGEAQTVMARELDQKDGVHTYDLWVFGSDGACHEYWREVRFQEIEKGPISDPVPASQFGPLIERGLRQRLGRKIPLIFEFNPNLKRERRRQIAQNRWTLLDPLSNPSPIAEPVVLFEDEAFTILAAGESDLAVDVLSLAEPNIDRMNLESRTLAREIQQKGAGTLEEAEAMIRGVLRCVKKTFGDEPFSLALIEVHEAVAWLQVGDRTHAAFLLRQARDGGTIVATVRLPSEPSGKGSAASESDR